MKKVSIEDDDHKKLGHILAHTGETHPEFMNRVINQELKACCEEIYVFLYGDQQAPES